MYSHFTLVLTQSPSKRPPTDCKDPSCLCGATLPVHRARLDIQFYWHARPNLVIVLWLRAASLGNTWVHLVAVDWMYWSYWSHWSVVVAELSSGVVPSDDPLEMDCFGLQVAVGNCSRNLGNSAEYFNRFKGFQINLRYYHNTPIPSFWINWRYIVNIWNDVSIEPTWWHENLSWMILSISVEFMACWRMI